MLSLLNDHLRKNGKPVLGFVNPLIYKMAEAVGVFQKIGSLSTNNNGGCTYGYTSNPTDHGWDPVRFASRFGFYFSSLTLLITGHWSRNLSIQEGHCLARSEHYQQEVNTNPHCFLMIIPM